MAEQGRYRAALIGAGRIGMLLESDPRRVKPATHFEMWASHPRTELVAVCDTDPAKLERARELLPGVATYTDPAQLLERERPDVISIATWRDSHYAMLKLALERGLRVIVVEKPIAEQYEDAKEVVDEAEALGAELLVNHRRRFDPLLQELRKELADGVIGDILQVSSFYVYGLLTTGTHLVDTLRLLLADVGGEIVWAAGFPNGKPHLAPGDDPCVDAFVGFESGLKVAIQSLDMKKYDIFQFALYGERGLVVLKNIGREIEIFRVVDSPEHEGFTELEPAPSVRRGGEPRPLFRYLADNAVGCLDGTETSLSSGRDSLKALEVLTAIQRSADAGGAPVRLR